MPNNILDQIINKRIKDIDEEKKKTSIKSINESIEISKQPKKLSVNTLNIVEDFFNLTCFF